MSTVIRIDNVDPQIIYSGTWTTHPSESGYNHTISLTRRIGNSATLNFIGKSLALKVAKVIRFVCKSNLKFQGNSVAVVGQLGPHPPNAPAITRYQVDDGDPVTFAPASPSSDLTRMLFYQSPALPFGPHKLVMTNMMDLDWIWFDYFEVTSLDGLPQLPGISSSTGTLTIPQQTSPTSGRSGSSTSQDLVSTTGAQPQAPITTISTLILTSISQGLDSFTAGILPSDAPTFVPSPQGDSNSSENSTRTGPIVGAILGSIAFLGIGIALILCLRRRRRNAIRDPDMTTLDSSPRQNDALSSSYSVVTPLTSEMRTQNDMYSDSRYTTYMSTRSSIPPSSISTFAERTVDTPQGNFTAQPGPSTSKRRLQLATVASPELPLPTYSAS
ncbi:hypothetical protein CVT24_000562 [Panaeolus cyanescens]|uniref:Uncharacterized protein n=1 Tax=Panaeolus cyanescens TaxID=181874 RepID=A0A409W702_9AGAR|nr:hypothetical protein CVT24_000562 [Panaeolus cyanescens]